MAQLSQDESRRFLDCEWSSCEWRSFERVTLAVAANLISQCVVLQCVTQLVHTKSAKHVTQHVTHVLVISKQATRSRTSTPNHRMKQLQTQKIRNRTASHNCESYYLSMVHQSTHGSDLLPSCRHTHTEWWVSIDINYTLFNMQNIFIMTYSAGHIFIVFNSANEGILLETSPNTFFHITHILWNSHQIPLIIGFLTNVFSFLKMSKMARYRIHRECERVRFKLMLDTVTHGKIYVCKWDDQEWRSLTVESPPSMHYKIYVTWQYDAGRSAEVTKSIIFRRMCRRLRDDWRSTNRRGQYSAVNAQNANNGFLTSELNLKIIYRSVQCASLVSY